jgi:uncharacterized protein YdcH (DUF465 family)
VIFFDEVQPILETITDAQDHLSEDTWPDFVGQLLERSSRIVRLAEEEDEEDWDITSAEAGRTALREIEWEDPGRRRRLIIRPQVVRGSPR